MKKKNELNPPMLYLDDNLDLDSYLLSLNTICYFLHLPIMLASLFLLQSPLILHFTW